MKFAIIDTETSGLFDFSKPADADGQPRLAHLHMIKIDDDGEGVRVVDLFVKPDGWEISEAVSAINGLTTEKLAEIGVPISEAIDAYAKAIDEGHIVVAFNAQYDTKVMRGEMRRAEVDDRFDRTPNICIMRALTNICQIQKKTGKGWKFPKLSEACAHFGIENDAEHSADGDARACRALFNRLRADGALPDAAVHYAKVQPDRSAAE